MKKGCFIQIIVVLTIVTAAVLYIVNNKFDEIIFNPSKSLIVNQITKDLNYVKDTPEKDSLRSLITNYINNLKSIKSISKEPIEKFVDSLKVALQDSIIDKREYKNLSKILKSKIYHERPKKD
jgi:tRNA C32,U32 (ribose-2'-O)-methylase TrmJ